jgi:DNA-binding transcriptional MerR regulator
VRIGELATATGVTSRALRHYEDRGLLRPSRTNGGYREFEPEDVVRVEQIQAMIAAGLSTALIGQYLDCARTEEHSTHLEMCPDLRAALDALSDRFEREQAALHERRSRLTGLISAGRTAPATSSGPHCASAPAVRSVRTST